MNDDLAGASQRVSERSSRPPGQGSPATAARRCLGGYRGYLFDLDGTLYLGDRLLPGARELVERLRSLGRRVVFLSNNPTRTREQYGEKLTRLGIPAEAADVVTSAQVMAIYLGRTAPGSTLYVVGEPPLVEELRSAGFSLSEGPDEIDIVVCGFDRTFTYEKLNVALQAIRRGARFVATNPDRTCPVEGGEIPDCAAMIGAIEGATGKRVEVIVGKPSPIIVEVALESIGLDASDCLVVGDRLETDVRTGANSGMDSALVLTGVTSPEQLEASSVRPTYVLSGVVEILDALRHHER